MATHEHEDPKVKAIKYIETKKIKILFESLTSKLLQSQPIDPIQFLIDELQTIMAHRAQNKKIHTFNQNEIESLFDAFDVTQRGTISIEQLNEGVAVVIGNKKDVEMLPLETDSIDKQTFIRIIVEQMELNSL